MELWLPIARMRDVHLRFHAANGLQRSDATVLGKRMTEK
jgi:hypothetical protein